MFVYFFHNESTKMIVRYDAHMLAWIMSAELFQNKLVAVLNKNIEPGKVMNALAHMCIGLGSAIGQPDLRLTDLRC